MNYSAFILVAALLLAGCSHEVNRRGVLETRDMPTEYVSATPATAAPVAPPQPNDSDDAPVAIELAPELEAVLNGGPDVSVDLIEFDRLQAWQARAEVRLQLEIQRGKSEYLNELLRLAEQSEVDFLQRFDVQSVAAGDTTGYQFRMFRLIRSRIESALRDTKASIVQLEALLSQLPTRTS